MLTAQLPQPLQEEFERAAQLLHNVPDGSGIQQALIEAIELWLSQQHRKLMDAEAKKTSELRPFALAAGTFRVPKGFEDPLPDDLLEAFEGQ